MFTKKYISTIFILSFSLGLCLNAQSNIPLSFPTDYISQFQDIHIDDAGVGYVAGSCGVLRKTEDAGQSWTTVTPPTNNDISSVECAPSGCSKALLLDQSGMFRLENNSWTDVTYEGFSYGGQLHWITDQIVIHETQGENYYRSNDGGLTWSIVPYEASQTSNMSILDDGNGYVVVDKKLFKTTNQWERIDSVGYTHPTNIYVMTWLDANNGWFFDQDRLFYATTDAGNHWTLLNAESQLSSVNWMVALSSTHLVGAQIVSNRIESFDGGVTWERGSFLEGGNTRVNSKYHRQGDAFYLVGSQNQLLYSESGFSNFEELAPFGRFRSIGRIVFESDDIGYALNNSELLKTTDGGHDWFGANPSAGGNDLGLLDNGALVLLSNGAAKISMDQADTFTEWLPDELTPSSENPTKFAKTPNGNIYLMSYNYGYLSTDGGINFTAINTGHGFTVTGLFFLDENNGYAVGRQSQFMHTSDGGQSWTMGTGPANNSVDLYFTDTDNGWVSTASSRYITSDKGETWVSQNAKGGYDVTKHPDGSLLIAKYASGNNGILNHSTDNGASWTSLAYNCFAYRSGALTPSGKYFFAGGDGFIVRHDMEALLTSTHRIQPQDVQSLKVFPNPVIDQLTIEIPASSVKSFVEIYDNQGQRLSLVEVPAGQERINISLLNLPTAVYLIRWVGQKGMSVSKVIKI